MAVSADDDVRVGDYGTVFEVILYEDGAVVDISSQTALEIRFKKPSGTTVVQAATLSTNGTDGKFQYETVSGDIDQVGNWKIQGGVTMPSWVGSSSIDEFEVIENL